MTRTTSFEIQRALVRTLRANGALNSSLPGGWHEGIAPRGTAMPFGTYTLVPGSIDDDFSSRLLRVSYDVVITSGDQVEASTLDSLASETLEDNLEPVTGQTTLYCRRSADLRDNEETEAGERIYRVGGTYSIWTNQPL